MTTSGTSLLQSRYMEIVEWLQLSAFEDLDIPALQEELVHRLEAYGFSLFRMHIGVPMLHPLHAVFSYNWSEETGSEIQNFVRGFPQSDAWLRSPVRPVYESGANEGLYRIEAGTDSDTYPMLKDWGDQGATAYFLQLISYSDRTLPPDQNKGIVLSWTSNAPGGFTEDQLDLLRRIHLPLCAQLRSMTNQQLVNVILDAYLGPYSSQRVYDGQIQRGDGDVIDAVILFCDLRGSSRLAERYGLQDFLAVLNDYYEITAGAVLEGGGEVLRYIGDASLAIFPLERYVSRTEACQAALDVALAAVKRGAVINQKRLDAGELPIDFGIGLHVGTVMYGNIGTRTRIEFTVIGPAANEAARIEAQCKELGETVLVSDTFADSLDHPWRSHGQFELRNIGRPIEIFSPVA